MSEHAAEVQNLVAQARGILHDTVAIVQLRDQEEDAVVRLAGIERARFAASLDGLAQIAALAFGRGAKQSQPAPNDIRDFNRDDRFRLGARSEEA